ncbi:amidohydrolase family protein [Halobacteria archaeon AArc-curdl1]|uniref:Amidohydrolase family protein n=1 Tax=Natronosalvus hydrolyticus TaxID=2979988 RepID=A0AAP3E5J6_9EURY|nr:amidohydrolase family protein [Halobacteria archaeon AArc-curdl1]
MTDAVDPSETTLEEPFAIRTDGIYDPTRDGIGRSVVIVDGDRVLEVRDDVPADVPIAIDHDGFAIPGLVDAHSHATIRPGDGDQLGQLGADRTVAAVRATTNLRRDLEAGTTTMRLMAEEGYLDVRLAELEREGELHSPRLLPSGIHLTPTDGHGMVHTATDGVDEIRRRIRANMREGATHTKLFATGGVSSDTGELGRSLYTREEVRAIVDETHRHGVHVAAHAHGGEGARIAIEEGVDTIEHAALFTDEEIALLESHNRFVVGNFAISSHPTGIKQGEADQPAILAKLEEANTRRSEVWQQILQANCDVAVGTDSMHGLMHYEIQTLADLGATPARALNAGTLDAARCIDREAEVGSVEPGKRADLVLLAGNPLEDLAHLENPVGVIKDGKRVA